MGIGGGELLFIIVVALMLFGSDKIPGIARTLGKGYAQLRNATNEIKNEINKSAQENNITNTINEEVNKARTEIQEATKPLQLENPIEEIKEDFENLTGPIKRLK